MPPWLHVDHDMEALAARIFAIDRALEAARERHATPPTIRQLVDLFHESPDGTWLEQSASPDFRGMRALAAEPTLTACSMGDALDAALLAAADFIDPEVAVHARTGHSRRMLRTARHQTPRQVLWTPLENGAGELTIRALPCYLGNDCCPTSIWDKTSGPDTRREPDRVELASRHAFTGQMLRRLRLEATNRLPAPTTNADGSGYHKRVQIGDDGLAGRCSRATEVYVGPDASDRRPACMVMPSTPPLPSGNSMSGALPSSGRLSQPCRSPLVHGEPFRPDITPSSRGPSPRDAMSRTARKLARSIRPGARCIEAWLSDVADLEVRRPAERCSRLPFSASAVRVSEHLRYRYVPHSNALQSTLASACAS